MILLDTHVLLWLVNDEQKLGQRAREVVEREWAAGSAAASAMSFWEAALLLDRGRITLRQPVRAMREYLLRTGLKEIPVDGEIAVRAVLLNDFHRDPADRLIVATALDGHELMTADESILNWPGDLARLDARV